jgi:hypothetical protein
LRIFFEAGAGKGRRRGGGKRRGGRRGRLDGGGGRGGGLRVTGVAEGSCVVLIWGFGSVFQDERFKMSSFNQVIQNDIWKQNGSNTVVQNNGSKTPNHAHNAGRPVQLTSTAFKERMSPISVPVLLQTGCAVSAVFPRPAPPPVTPKF